MPSTQREGRHGHVGGQNWGPEVHGPRGPTGEGSEQGPGYGSVGHSFPEVQDIHPQGIWAGHKRPDTLRHWVPGL